MHRSYLWFFLVVACLPGLALAGPERELQTLALPGVYWQSTQSAQLQGISLASRGFHSDQTPVQVAAALSTRYPQFRQVISVSGHLLLSGLDGGLHWLAHIEPHTRGTGGTVSVLQLPRQGLSGTFPSSLPQAQTPDWLPSGTRTVFDHADSPPGKARQRVFRVSADAKGLSAYLRQELRSRGWTSLGNRDAPGPAAWQRHDALMHVSLRPAGRGASLLYLHEQP